MEEPETLSTGASPFYIPTSKGWGCNFLHVHWHYFPFQKMRAILQVWSSISLQFWFSLPWWLGMLSIFSCIYCSFVHTLWRNIYSSLGPFFNWVVCLLVLSFGSSYKLCILNPYQKKNDLQVFSPILYVAFSFFWIMPVDEQKFLILSKFNLSIFSFYCLCFWHQI